MPGNLFTRVNTIGQGQPNDIDFLDHNNCPIGEIEITGVNAEETEAP